MNRTAELLFPEALVQRNIAGAPSSNTLISVSSFRGGKSPILWEQPFCANGSSSCRGLVPFLERNHHPRKTWKQPLEKLGNNPSKNLFRCVYSVFVRQFVNRRLAAQVIARMKDEPVVALQGPRTVGKSTLLNEVAKYHEARVLDLDKLAVRNAVSADPQTFAAGHALVCIDEFQKAPSILDAIKAELNRRLEPGRFVITGSTRFDALPMAAQALTGRIHIMDVLPFSQGELNGHDEKFLDIAFSYPASLVAPQKSSLTRAAYIKNVVWVVCLWLSFETQ